MKTGMRVLPGAQWLLQRSRSTKLLILIGIDFLMIPSALWLAFAVKFDSLSDGLSRHPALYAGVTASGLAVAALLGLYRTALRYADACILTAIASGAVASAVVLYVIGHTIAWRVLPASLVAIYALICWSLLTGTRFLARWLLSRRKVENERVVIYGAGEAGAELATALAAGREYVPVAYVDEKRALCGTTVWGIPVVPPDRLEGIVRKHEVKKILLAIPKASRRRRSQVISWLQSMNVHIQSVPNIDDIAAGRARIDELQEIDVNDLLGRDLVPPNKQLLDACIREKIVLVTGAGGSIGSELCRQILRQGPTRLCLLEMSEHALYQIDRELRSIIAGEGLQVELVALLGNAHHRNRMREIMRSYGVQTVYHAAAYKHVPIVEHNMVEGLHNNLVSAWYTGEAALECQVETFVLISTDKAVNPTNVMGATKRFAEVVLQGLQQKSEKTRFCMVRFGNVLESSGSVVPLFREQIRRGGPVTVTHPEVVRYFMTIPEAAQLVIQAGSMGTGGDVFVLDMGQPVKIYDLARRMIQLSGLTIRDEQNPDGDIEIEFSGLRPAEKLYEELLIGRNVTGTEHPMIMRAIEHCLPWDRVQALLTELMQVVNDYDCAAAREMLMRAVAEYQPNEGVQDLVWLRRRHTVVQIVRPPVGDATGRRAAH